jgi:hypothetical protein
MRIWKEAAVIFPRYNYPSIYLETEEKHENLTEDNW